MGTAKALTLQAALHLGIRAAIDGQRTERTRLGSSRDIYELMHHRLQWLDHEEFWTLYLSHSNEVIAERMIGKGGLDSTVVDVRVVLREALQLSAAGMAFVHNHPSGTLKPGVQDKELTRRLTEAARIFNIRVIDHIIVGANKGYFSFCDEGIL